MLRSPLCKPPRPLWFQYFEQCNYQNAMSMPFWVEKTIRPYALN